MTLSEKDFADKADNVLFQKIKTRKWDEVERILSVNDDADDLSYSGKTSGSSLAREPDVHGNLPLHAAIGFQAPDDIILALINLHPQACQTRGTDYWLPLHIAAMWGTSGVVLETIIRHHPAALDDRGQPGIKGRTPRHFSDRFPHNKEALERSTEDWMKLVAEERK